MDTTRIANERMFEEALRIATDAKERQDRLRERAANTAAWLLSYSPESEIAQQSPLFCDLMVRHGVALLHALKWGR